MLYNGQTYLNLYHYIDKKMMFWKEVDWERGLAGEGVVIKSEDSRCSPIRYLAKVRDQTPVKYQLKIDKVY